MVWLLLFAIFLILAILGWRVSDIVLKPAPYGLIEEFKIVDAADAEVTLPLPPNTKQFANTRREGRFGLVWEGGYGELGPILRENETTLTRELSNVVGDMPEADDAAQMDGFIYRRNPREDLGLEYQNLQLDGEVGPLRAWWLPGDKSVAVLMLHGRRRGEIIETLRVMPALTSAGYSVLSLSYRNHTDSAASPDGFYHYGDSEWRDVLTGLEFLREQGIEQVVLYGFSMGGAVAIEILKHYSAELPEIQALIMDSPLLDPRTVFRLGARNSGLPLPHRTADLALFVARLRAGIDWNAINQVRYAPDLNLPTLLIAGTNDQTTPIEMMDAFAANALDIDYHRVEADHVESWNHDSKQYEAWLLEFLGEHAPLD